MIEGGEDVKFIARRLLILASEDIGNANRNALLLAQCLLSRIKIRLPKSILSFPQCAPYLDGIPHKSIRIGVADVFAGENQQSPGNELLHPLPPSIILASQYTAALGSLPRMHLMNAEMIS